jgi:putative transposase
MPWGLERFQETRQNHFLTFSCYRRQPKLATAEACEIFVCALERVRQAYGLCVYGYVVMPEHVHLLVNEPERSNLAQALKSLKQGVSRRLALRAEEAFWQERYYDFNVWSERKFREKLRYVHRNPVKRGLVAKPEDWDWSSFRHYATGEIGLVEIESQWTARRRERAGVLLTAALRSPENPRSSRA